MHTLRRLPRRPVTELWVRTNATLQSADAASSTPPPPPAQTKSQPSPPPAAAKKTVVKTQNASAKTGTPKGKAAGSRTPARTRRPFITLEQPRKYMRPIPHGALPVYDLALNYIKRDSQMLKDELAEVKAELEKVEKSPEEIAQLREKANILEIQSEINLPSVRWKARNGLADLSKPVYRHLVEQRWREDGALDLLMERIHQMNVVPDLLPSLHPSLDLRLNFPRPPPKDNTLRNRAKRGYARIEPGVFLLPEQTRKPPKMYTTVFHTEPRLYTLLMVDLDVPDPENASFQHYLHWLQPNITLSTESRELTFASSHTPYIPPHPQRGTPYHRYALLLLPQQERIKVPVFSDAQRIGFDFRQFSETYGLDGSKGGGAHMWREVWDPTVSHIYKETLKLEEPVFGRIPKHDPYAEIPSKYF